VNDVLRTLESVIAILIISTVFITFYRTVGPVPEFETINWKVVGYGALRTLDRSLSLRQEVQTSNTTAIETKLSILLPASVNYTVRICGVSCASPGISSSEIVSVSYIVAGFRDNYSPRQVVLYIWPKS